jgi:hypothetical protein
MSIRRNVLVSSPVELGKYKVENVTRYRKELAALQTPINRVIQVKVKLSLIFN